MRQFASSHTVGETRVVFRSSSTWPASQCPPGPISSSTRVERPSEDAQMAAPSPDGPDPRTTWTSIKVFSGRRWRSPIVLRQLRAARGPGESEASCPTDDDGTSGVQLPAISRSRVAFSSIGDVHPVMRHAVAERVTRPFPASVCRPWRRTHASPGNHVVISNSASALKSAPNTGSQRWLAHQHLTDSNQARCG